MKVVINKCYGGFTLSPDAVKRYAELKGFTYEHDDDPHFPMASCITPEGEPVYSSDITRNDPALVQVVEELGGKASGMCSKLKVVEIPDDVEWEIDKYDGLEHIAEVHRTWG